MREKIKKMSDCLVDNMGMLVIDIQNGDIDIVKFIEEINKNMESFGNKIMEFKKNDKE